MVLLVVLCDSGMFFVLLLSCIKAILSRSTHMHYYRGMACGDHYVVRWGVGERRAGGTNEGVNI